MKNKNKSVEKLSASDFTKHPVWKFTGVDDELEAVLRPVKRLPIRSASDCLIGSMAKLANGRKVQCVVGNIRLRVTDLNEHLATLSVWNGGKVFHLARYWDVDRSMNGPAALARFLGEDVPNVFPISVDISHVQKSPPAVSSLSFMAEPPCVLCREDIIDRIVSDAMEE